MDGLLLFAHGARDPAWARPFEEAARRVADARPGMPATLAFLEFMQPGIEDAANALVQRGCSRIHVVPMFLGAGGHVRRDVPPLVERLRERLGIEFVLHPPLGDQDRVIQALCDTTLALIGTEEK
ncbi:sirohydrochlorin chelatase [Pelomonas sp. KK5]|uniref:sirohydrochlorin chelatase n=1 Tax=Pelomonas sp. KK5 TaxID=1855730 RepID=UPI00097C074F|nr:CbiX/SirB N-terminal domain-containing protein [Pelomonas sp. KK5]